MGGNWRRLWIGFLCFTLLGLVFAAQFYLYLRSFGREVTWAQTLKWNVGSWYLWGMLCPVIFWVSRRSSPARTGWPQAVAAHATFGVLIAVVHLVAYATWTWLAAPLGDGPATWSGTVEASFARGFSWDLFCYAAIAATAYAIDNARRYQEGLIRASRLTAQLARAQLDALRMQLQPHFLFNTLNTITALIRDDPRGAEEMVSRLSDLLRMTLDKSDVEETPLREELDFVRKYLEIQQVRFGDRLRISLDAAPGTLDVMVPPFILQPVVENAVRYGLVSEADQCQVSVTARLVEGTLLLETQDSGPGLGSKTAREGVGLSNTRARLQQAYGSRAGLALRNADAGGCVVSLRIPIGDRAALEGGLS